MSVDECEGHKKIGTYLTLPPAQVLFPGLKKATDEHKRRLFVFQKGCCALCDRPRPQNLDHDHDSGLVRGLLCISCNKLLGLLGRSIANKKEGWRVGKSDLHPPKWMRDLESVQ